MILVASTLTSSFNFFAGILDDLLSVSSMLELDSRWIILRFIGPPRADFFVVSICASNPCLFGSDGHLD